MEGTSRRKQEIIGLRRGRRSPYPAFVRQAKLRPTNETGVTAKQPGPRARCSARPALSG